MVHHAAAGLAGLLVPLLAATAQDPASEPSPDPHQEPERPVNRLAEESSPYLRQHRHNPVDWYPWGEEALQKARGEDKPIFLSIGYAACHWCHVMERESFENEEIAAVMNQHFVNIKVDREERPDLDEIYMAAVQTMTGSGGWPMSVWMTPDLKPFFGGTYYPPDDRMGRPGFKRVLQHLADAWKNEREKVEKGAEELAAHLRGALAPEMDPADPRLEYAKTAVRKAQERYDPQYGGFGQAPQFAPKFPHASELRVMLREHDRSGDEQALEMATKTLRAMAEGGMYDQLGGGFHRYSTDRQWLVPHFEKMLYDNALLTPAYLEAYAVTGDPFYADVARDTLDYVLREMQDARGGFYSTQDADSEGVEGKFFVWSKEEIDSLLGEDAELARLRWDVTEAGNWEHTNVLWAAMPVAEAAEKVGLAEAEARKRLENARQVLFEARSKRVHPGTDDKVLAAWNGMAISALARAWQVLGEERYLQAARRAADFVLSEMRREGRLLRTWREGEARLMGYLEDYALMAEACLDLYESDFDPRWLAEAANLATQMREHFHDPADGNFFFTADDHEELLARTKTVGESSTPSGIASATMAFLRLGLATGSEERYALGVGALRANNLWLERAPQACPTLVLAMQFHLSDPREVVVAGEQGDPAAAAMLAALRAEFPWHRVVLRVHDENRETLEELSPVVAGKEPVAGKAAAYVCRRGVCEAPVLDPEALQSR